MARAKRIPRPAADSILRHVQGATAEPARDEGRLYIVTARRTYWCELDDDLEMAAAVALERAGGAS